MHTRLQLDPLPEDDVRSLVAEILQRADDVPPSLVDLVVRTADGNPYYVEELVKWLVEEGVVDTTADTWRVAARAVRTVRVPTTLRGLLQARLDSLEVPERAVIGGAAVVGRVFWDQAVARLATALAEPDRATALERLTEREVIFRRPHSTVSGSHEFSFRHALMRDVAYEGVLRSVRRAHHALAAQWLEEAVDRSQRPDEHAAAVAHHHEEAGHKDSRRPLVPARRAARRRHLRRGRRPAAARPRPRARPEGRARPVVRRAARPGVGARPDGPAGGAAGHAGRTGRPPTASIPPSARGPGSPRAAGCSSAATTPPSRPWPRRPPTSPGARTGPTWSPTPSCRAAGAWPTSTSTTRRGSC